MHYSLTLAVKYLSWFAGLCGFKTLPLMFALYALLHQDYGEFLELDFLPNPPRGCSFLFGFDSVSSFLRCVLCCLPMLVLVTTLVLPMLCVRQHFSLPFDLFPFCARHQSAQHRWSHPRPPGSPGRHRLQLRRHTHRKVCLPAGYHHLHRIQLLWDVHEFGRGAGVVREGRSRASVRPKCTAYV